MKNNLIRPASIIEEHLIKVFPNVEVRYTEGDVILEIRVYGYKEDVYESILDEAVAIEKSFLSEAPWNVLLITEGPFGPYKNLRVGLNFPSATTFPAIGNTTGPIQYKTSYATTDNLGQSLIIKANTPSEIFYDEVDASKVDIKPQKASKIERLKKHINGLGSKPDAFI